MPTHTHKTHTLFLSSILEAAMIANISIAALLSQEFFIPGQRYLKPRQFSTGGFELFFRIKEVMILGSTLKKGKIYPKLQCWKAPDRCSGPALSSFRLDTCW